MFVRIYVCSHLLLCMHVCMHVSMYTLTHVCMCVHVCMHVCLYMYMYVHTCYYACVFVCMSVCTYDVYVGTYALHTHSMAARASPLSCSDFGSVDLSLSFSLYFACVRSVTQAPSPSPSLPPSLSGRSLSCSRARSLSQCHTHSLPDPLTHTRSLTGAQPCTGTTNSTSSTTTKCTTKCTAL